jgi:hypothetical protein
MGTSTSQLVTLTDTGNANLMISTVSATGSGFSASGGSNVTLTPNQSATVSVYFEPTGVGGVQGSLSIASNASNSPLTIALSGTGLQQATQNLGTLSANTTSVNFGKVAVGTSTAQLVTLTDTGNANVTISTISAAGSGFSDSGGSNMTLTPNQSVTVSVNFEPAGVGGVQGSLSIPSNASNSLLTIALSGTGFQHSVALNWQASASQVVGYFVYRGSAADSLSKLITTADTSTSYTDTAVTGGQTYVYAVTSVDSSNVESAQSAPLTVSIPNN